MARKYSRDNRGRFASGGGGATARGGRLRTAAGNKRATQTMKAAGGGGDGVIRGRAARTVAGESVMRKLPKAAPKAVATAKGAGIGGSRKVESVGVLKTNKELGRRGMVGMSANRKAVRRSDVTERRMEKLARVTERGKPSEMMARRRNSTVSTYSPDGKFNQSAANLNQKKAARTKALAERNAYAGQGRAAAASSFNRKPKPPKPAAPAKAKAAPKARGIDDSKVSRVIGRVNGVVRGAEQKSGVKRLNATQVGVRAKSFLARKEGGSVGMLNQKSQPEAFASVRKAMTKPPKYSTQTPNRNKPGRFNDLGQDKARAKAKLEARTARDRIRDGNAAAKAKSDKAKPSRLLGRREIYGGTMGAPGDAKGPRIKGTIAKPKAPKAAPSSEVARTRKQAGSYQRARTKGRLEQVKLSQAWANKGKSSTSKPFYVGKQLKRSDTGMRQLSLTGGSKTLYKFKRK